MLIVEGTDLVGKTTLCKELMREAHKRGVPAMYQHFGLLPERWDYYWDYIPYITSFTMMDRFIMSEVCYGVVARGVSKIDPETYRLLDADCREYGTVTVVLVAEEDFLREQHAAQSETMNQMFTADQIVAVNDKFKNLIEGTLLNGALRFRADIDFGFHVTRDKFIADDLTIVNKIIDKWQERMKFIKAVGRRHA